jgi:hypothetical protein
MSTTQHPHVTEPPPRRSEADLREALASLERLAPSRESVLRPRAGLRRRAAPRRRIVAVAACLLAVAVAVVELSSHTATTPGRTGTHPALRQAILTAFDSAAGMVLESRATVTGDGTVTGRTVSWMGPTLPRPDTTARYRFVSTTPGGRPLSELAELYTARRPDFSGLGAGFVGSGGVTRRITTVDYSTRTWTSRTTRQDAIVSLADDPALLRREVARGLWRVAGHVTIAGRPALELAWKASRTTTAWPMGSPDRSGELRRTLWVDAHTYLPIRQRIQLGSGLSGPFSGITADYRLLAPTPANLARLQPVVPKGFTRTHGLHGALPTPVWPFL